MTRKLTIPVLVLLLAADIVQAQQVLTLDDCREMAVNGNKTLSEARTKVEMAGYDRKIALAYCFPEISAKGAYVYNNRNLSLISQDASDALTGTGTKIQDAFQGRLSEVLSDPSVAAAALGVGPQDLINDLNTMGFFFENLCIRDLRIYAELLDGTVYHYRDRSGLECDAVLHLRNGRYGLIEIKLGGDDPIREGAQTLMKLTEKIDTAKMYPPTFRMILTGVSPYAYQREDGIFVVPAGCLKP